MAMYRKVMDNFTHAVSEIQILRVEDNAFIPNDPDNINWQEYQAWLEAGNVPDPVE